MSVKCTECNAELRITGESGNVPIDHFLLWNYLALKAERQYMQCVLSLSQGLEMALMETARFVLIVEPVKQRPEANSKDVGDLVDLFQKKTRNMTLEPLRNLLIKLAVHGIRPKNVHEAYRWVTEVNNLAKDLPSAKLVQTIPDKSLRGAVSKLRKVTVGVLRNDVGHHAGRRPTEQEAEAHHQEIREVVREVMTTFGVTPGGGQLIVTPPPRDD